MIRVLLAELTGVLRAVVHGALDEQEDMEVVGEASNSKSVRAAVIARRVDVVVWGTDRASASNIEALIQRPLLPKVLTIEDDGRRGSAWSLRYEQTGLGQLSPVSLVEAIRQVCAENRVPEG